MSPGTTTNRKKKTTTFRGARVKPIGVIRSVLKTRREAPKQGPEGAPAL